MELSLLISGKGIIELQCHDFAIAHEMMVLDDYH
jgi:hypothetical protein